MKVLILLVCAVAGGAYGGSVAWPGALVASPVVRTIIPPQSKTVAYSSTQYINAVPSAHYTVGLQPNFAYEYPQVANFAPLQQAYYPFAGASYYPSSSVFYPSLAPIAAEYPVASIPSYPAGFPAGIAGAIPAQIPAVQPPNAPENPASDSDSTVVDSAEFPQQQQQLSTEAPEAPSSTTQAPPTNNFPNFPDISQISGTAPSFPQLPQFPQGSLPQFPQFPSNPLFPQSPSPSPSPPSNFPGAIGGDQGLNDEDTVSVESA